MNNSYPCIEPGCTNRVYFSPRDEEFYRQKGWTDPQGNVIKPKRCKYHREMRKKQREQQKNINVSDLL